MKTKAIFALSFLSITYASFGQSLDEKYGDDVKTIDAIINAYYGVISGSSDDPWQFERDKYLHASNAVITRLDSSGKAEIHSLEAEYIPMGLNPRESFYEVELKRTVSHYGNMAQVWSAFEVRTDANTPGDVRGLNSIQLHFENNRWYIDNWTVQMEEDGNNLVADFLNDK